MKDISTNSLMAVLFGSLVVGGCGTTSVPPVYSNGGAITRWPIYANAKVAGPLVWVVSVNNQINLNTIEGFALFANGNVTPSAIIGGSNVPIVADAPLSTGPNGEIYAVGCPAHCDEINEFSRDSSGNVAPKATITCGGISYPGSVAVGTFGKLVVAMGSPPSVAIIPRYSNGCVNGNPIIQGSNLVNPQGVSALPNGDIVVEDNAESIKVFDRSANGNATPTRTIEGSRTEFISPSAVATDRLGYIYVTDYAANSVSVFRPQANGDVRPLYRIAGPNTALYNPDGISVSSDGRIFVSNYAASSIVVFAPGSNGNAAPIQAISGSETGLNNPHEISVSAK